MEPSFEILPFKRISSFNLSLLSLFCEFSRDHAIKIINFKKKEIKLLTKEQQKPYKNAKICFISKE